MPFLLARLLGLATAIECSEVEIAARMMQRIQ